MSSSQASLSKRLKMVTATGMPPGLTPSQQKLYKVSSIILNICERSFSFFFAFTLAPFYYILFTTCILQAYVETYKSSTKVRTFLFLISTFGFINIIGNTFMSILTKTRVKNNVVKPNNSESSNFCKFCNMVRPPNCHHCRTCKCCVLRREYHCVIFNKCIGLYNRRYYVVYLAYITFAMVFCSYFNYLYAKNNFERVENRTWSGYDWFNTAKRLYTYSLLNVLREDEALTTDLKIAFSMFSILIFLWSCSYFLYQVYSIIKGTNASDKAQLVFNQDVGTIRTLLRRVQLILGTRWYFAIIWPFARSPLPDFSELYVKDHYM